ncbi:Putative Permease of the major facilitator superfamily [Penicillium brasilianum]|uniref:Putative Permease of the major facilitator superfamily n=1 Tax=Penicillium brasilianum TaxID=104259 RepID=A0A0F7TY01_PENBI|nr:Putative Permease of the major facilitator superfamily [Penicillium brasilianum]
MLRPTPWGFRWISDWLGAIRRSRSPNRIMSVHLIPSRFINMVDKDIAVMHLETQPGQGTSAADADFLSNFSDEAKKKVLRKVDTRLIPMLVLLYLVAYVDKTNIGNAKIEGLLSSLHMDGIQYNIALSIFFIPYVLAEVPSNIILNRLMRPSHYLGFLIFCWGVIMLCTGFVQNFAGLVVIRVLLGLFEAGFLPGAVLVISKWYLPNETQTRIAILYTSAASGGAFSGLLAFAIAKMDGVAGYEGWRWIFIIEGIATCAIAVACYLLLPDLPSLSAGWLSPEEIRFLEVRQLTHNNHDSHHTGFNKRVIFSVLCDWKMYFLILINWSNAVPNYALKFSMPEIIKSMGYQAANAQLLTIPPYMVGAFSAFGFSVFADRFSWRMPFILAPQLSLIVAFAILFSKAADIENNIALCYFGVCLACFGMYPILPGVNAWNVCNILDPHKRAVAIGYLICVGNAGGIIGSYIYQTREAPQYPTGYGTSLAFAAAGIVACLTLEFCLWRANKTKDRMTASEIEERYTEDQLHDMGEKSPLFKYTL